MGSHPIYVAPDTVKYVVSPTNYPALVEDLKGDKDATNFVEEPLGGSVTINNIDFKWSFDQVTFVSVTIVKKHGLMRFVPNATIFDQLSDVLATLKV